MAKLSMRAETHRGGRGRGYAGSSGRKIYSRADALLHAVPRSRWNARWIPAGLPCLTWLCSHAPGICNCVFQFRQCRNSSHGFWKNTREPLLESIGIQISKRPQSVRRPEGCLTFCSALRATAAILVAVN